MNKKEWKSRDPFALQYYQEELAFYGEHSYKDNGLELVHRCPGPVIRLDDYLNVNMRLDMPAIPTLYLNGQLWMSITPMEVQSQHVPIQSARGIVATAGLGMGHFVLRAAGMGDVDEVHVFECDPRVVAAFCAVHGKRKEMSKVQFHEGDAREKLLKCDMRFDTLYVDIYPDLCSDEVIEDIGRFIDLAEDYSWWGRELVLLNSLHYGLINGGDLSLLSDEVLEFISLWEESELSKLRHRQIGQQYCEDILALIW